MNELKPILYFDMDGVLVDFRSGIEALNLSPEEYRRHAEANDFDEIPGIFSLMQPTYGAVCAVRHLAKYYDVRILTTAPWNNPSAWADKLLWTKKHFAGLVEPDAKNIDGNPFYKKITITHDKSKAIGSTLIDDDLKKENNKNFRGERIWFRYSGNTHAKCSEGLQALDIKEATNWYDILDYLMPLHDESWKEDKAQLIKDY